ncbi:uncharacterized protein LOC123666184 [Melitaea cinxia]|uniref:uncharacterized protein LOC123666184 n=1 Tax=Melitaea cinxia TaxID=113334 RepID=UPI001E26F327|nr:uncharacterized protein LOC123666184 [Melitaea cinxia]
MEESIFVGEHSDGSRKRPRNKNLRARRKEARYRDSDPALLAFNPPCTHTTKRYSCCLISMNYLIYAKQKIYDAHTKIEQDRRLSYMLRVSGTKRSRPVAKPKTKSRNAKKFSVKYYIPVKQGKMMPVCAKFFQKLFNVSQTRINSIAKGVFSGEGVHERRGGNHKAHLYAQKKQAVIEFISKLEGSISHYNRLKSKRIYLPSTLSINKLYKIYNSQANENLKVKKTFFATIFCTKFNIGFGTPAVDVCSYCKRMASAMRAETDTQKKNSLMHNLGAHKLRAKTFHKLLKADYSDSVRLCFDLQQIHPLPKLNISEAYYARQINFYTFCIVDLNMQDSHFFTWTETEAGKGSVEISSAILSYLQTYNFAESKTKLRLFCDGCGGQNKNMHVVHSLCWWLFTKAPVHIEEVVLFYPVRGHSYMPPDRVFGVVEKELKKREEIITRKEYTQVYSEKGKVHELGKEWNTLDIKSLSEFMKKMDGIRDAKRIYIKKTMVRNKATRQLKPRIDVKMENFYNADTGKDYGPIMKRGFKIENIPEPAIINNNNLLNQAKKNDVNMLLKKRFGEEWQDNGELEYYKKIINSDGDGVTDSDQEQQEMCDCLEEEDEISKF